MWRIRSRWVAVVAKSFMGGSRPRRLCLCVYQVFTRLRTKPIHASWDFNEILHHKIQFMFHFPHPVILILIVIHQLQPLKDSIKIQTCLNVDLTLSLYLLSSLSPVMFLSAWWYSGNSHNNCFIHFVAALTTHIVDMYHVTPYNPWPARNATIAVSSYPRCSLLVILGDVIR